MNKSVNVQVYFIFFIFYVQCVRVSQFFKDNFFFSLHAAVQIFRMFFILLTIDKRNDGQHYFVAVTTKLMINAISGNIYRLENLLSSSCSLSLVKYDWLQFAHITIILRQRVDFITMIS